MKIIKHIKASIYKPSQIYKMFNEGEIYIDNSFQRRYVWEEKHQIALIETILLGYDIPAIYLWEQKPDPKTGKTVFSVVDGQQRIGAIVKYIRDEFPLKKKHLISNIKLSTEWQDKRFSELPDNLKTEIWSYTLNVNMIGSEVSLEEIKTMFLRLNLTNKVLNPQELRNARFNGKFIKLAMELSELGFWKNYNVFSVNDIRRMKDVEFISHLLIFLRMGMKIATNQVTINKVYDLYNRDYKEYDDDKNMVNHLLVKIENVFNFFGKNCLHKINKTTHIYTLFVVLYALQIENYYGFLEEKVLHTICMFYKKYFEDEHKDREINLYRLFSQDAVASLTSRINRYNCLIEFIKKNTKL